MPPKRTKSEFDGSTIIPAKSGAKEKLASIERFVKSQIGDILLEGNVTILMLQQDGVWIECKMKLREKLFCQALVASMDVAMAAGAVRASIPVAEAMIKKTDPRNYVSILLQAQLDDTYRSPEQIRSATLKIHDAVMRGIVTHHQAAQALKALELYAKMSGMMVQEQEVEKKSQPLGFAPG